MTTFWVIVYIVTVLVMIGFLSYEVAKHGDR